MFAPRSIAIVGASDKPSISRILIESLAVLGFDGAVFPVNPRYATVAGRPCFPSLREMPERPDLVAFCLGPDHLEASVREAAQAGVPAGVIYAGGFAEQDAAGKALQARIAGIARDAQIALCGPNCMGVLSPHDRSTSFIQVARTREGLAGNVGLISHSGSVCIGLLGDVRRFGFSAVVSAGNEAVLSCADYLDFLVDDERTSVIAAFIEAVRDPGGFVAALDRAAARNKPVVVLTAGRSERTRSAITSHTGALAADHRVLSAVLHAHGAIEVADTDEMTETIAALQGRRRPDRRPIMVTTGSGGLAELLLDVATETGIDLPALSAAERADAESVIGQLGGDGNPIDYWGTGDYRRNLPHALRVGSRSGRFGSIVLCTDAFEDSPLGSRERALDYARTLADAAAESQVAHFYLNTRPGVMNRSQVALLREAGVAVVTGMRQGLGAIDRVARWAQPPPGTRAARRQRSGPGLAEFAGQRRHIGEIDAKRLLGGYGLPVVGERRVTSAAGAVEAAAELGYPVVLKAVADEIPHKTEHGLVLLDLQSQKDLERAWATLATRVAASRPAGRVDYVAQKMVHGEIELFAGVVKDPSFGLAMLVGLGGIYVELLRDFTIRMLPLREGDAEAMIAGLRGAALLGAVRGRAALDVPALAECLYGLSDLAVAEQDHFQEIDVNPVKLHTAGKGCTIVDALITAEHAA